MNPHIEALTQIKAMLDSHFRKGAVTTREVVEEMDRLFETKWNALLVEPERPSNMSAGHAAMLQAMEDKNDPCDEPPCDGCDGSGIRPDATPHAGKPPEGYVVIERCDTCMKFPGDLEAATAWGDDAQWQYGKGTVNAIAKPRTQGVPHEGN